MDDPYKNYPKRTCPECLGRAWINGLKCRCCNASGLVPDISSKAEKYSYVSDDEKES